MAGPLTIQRFPKGLLSLLAMKGSGQAPSELAAEIRGMVNLTPLFMLDGFASWTTATANISADGYNAAATNLSLCPAGEMWVPINYTIQRTTAPLAAGTNATMGMAYLRSSTNGIQAFGPERVVAAAQRFVLGYNFQPFELVMQPNDSFGMYTINGTYGTPFPVTMTLDYIRIPL